MTRIAEFKEIDGAIWVRIDLKTDPSGVGLYTPDEIEAIRRDARSGPENALRGLMGTLGTAATQDDRRIVSIPHTGKFWEAYDEAKIWL